MITPPRRPPKLSAITVAGIKAFRNACFMITVRLRQALRARRPHVVRVDHLQHRGAHETAVLRDARDGEHDHREREMLGPVEQESVLADRFFRFDT